MKKPSLSDLAHLAEIVAAVAVILSLIYVGRGLKDNTAAVRAASMHEITNASRQSLLSIASDENLAKIRFIGDQDPSQLSEMEAYRYFFYTRQLWLNFQNVWMQWRLAVLDDQLWGGYENVLCALLDNPGIRMEWSNHASALDPGFVTLVERCPNFD